MGNKQIIESFLNKIEVKYDFDEQLETFNISFKATNSYLDVVIIFNEEYVLVVTRVPQIVDENKIHDIEELVIRINDTLISGNIDFNYEKRLLAFRAGIHLFDLELTESLFQTLFFSSIAGVDTNLKTISQVLNSDVRPKDAISASTENIDSIDANA